MKRNLLLILVALLPVVASAYDAEIDGIYYNISGDEASVTYYSYWFVFLKTYGFHFQNLWFFLQKPVVFRFPWFPSVVCRLACLLRTSSHLHQAVV